jgi:hypothetical protein
VPEVALDVALRASRVFGVTGRAAGGGLIFWHGEAARNNKSLARNNKTRMRVFHKTRPVPSREEIIQRRGGRAWTKDVW